MKTFLFILGFTASSAAFSLSLGDTVNSNTIAAETTTNQKMLLSGTSTSNSTYIIKSATGNTNVLVNNKNQVYGFNWSEKTPNLPKMLGTKYLQEYQNAYNSRKVKNLRVLNIDTPRLSVQQFGLPGGKIEGEMIAKDLAPAQ